MGSITSSVKSASTPWTMRIKKKKWKRQIEIGTTTQDTTNYHSFSLPGVYLQECHCNSILLTPLLHSSSGFPPLLLSCDVKKKKKKVLKTAITLPKSKTEVHWTEQNLISGSPHPVRDTMQASLQEAMFSVIHRRRGDTMSACWRDHKCFRPVCMCMKQFVSLYNQMTPHSPQTWPLSIKGGLWFIITWVLFLKF